MICLEHNNCTITETKGRLMTLRRTVISRIHKEISLVPQNHTEITDAQFLEAKLWVSDCEWGECLTLTDIGNLSRESIFQGIKTHYHGGWAQFIADGS